MDLLIKNIIIVIIKHRPFDLLPYKGGLYERRQTPPQTSPKESNTVSKKKLFGNGADNAKWKKRRFQTA